MKTYKYILGIDPSGNFEEGKGTTGMCLLNAETNTVELATTISAKDFDSKEAYWAAHINYIDMLYGQHGVENVIIVIEDFTLDPKRAMQQSYSRMETPKLIGIIQLHCKTKLAEYHMQRPVDVKRRWADHILQYKGYIKIGRNNLTFSNGKVLSRHIKDAMRHAVHYYWFYNNKEK